MENMKELLKEFIEWVEEKYDGDFFYVFKCTEKAIDEFLKERKSYEH